jgi:hypothetical protein
VTAEAVDTAANAAAAVGTELLRSYIKRNNARRRKPVVRVGQRTWIDTINNCAYRKDAMERINGKWIG